MLKIPISLLLLLILAFSCTSVQPNQQVVIDQLDLKFNSNDIKLSNEAERYIESVVAIMKQEALHKQDLNFDEIHQLIRYYANGAQSQADTHQAIKKALPLLKDHHSSFLTAAQIHQYLGLTAQAIEEIKKGKAPHIDSSKVDSLKTALPYASAKLISGNIGYLSVPAFDNLFSEAMTMFADSLQTIIRQLDQQPINGWIIDLRENDGGAAMPMITGLGPLLDDQNCYYTVDKQAKLLAKSYYKEGGYYDVEVEEQRAKKKVEPLVQSSINYRIKKSSLPVALLTSFKTASSAEAVTAIFAGQANVKIIGSKTNGLTTTNSFKFLADNSALNLTIGYYANRHQQVYKQGIAPDIELQRDTNPTEKLEEDPSMQMALDWIAQ
ncbi:S41 family peptidase [Rhodocytophaga aerolata]|uniref:S41 family peptidase n=1 Tax=Rhodocytophaga aerolata TaxID=455078 RepID=A0ABT8RKM5_9BACT|nr:S41 family peptidase [Rhodocytophaga aerolata]MDO1451660.1 S41 family peptidase [Rhodocytophaga aerolata]